MANSNIIYPQLDWSNLSRVEQIEKMDLYYSNNDAYEAARLLAYWNGTWNEDIRPIRTPVHRSVEFFVNKIAIGDPMVSAKNQALTDAVGQILDWSNFQIQKPMQIRNMAKYGGSFRKAISQEKKVRFQSIETKEVTSVKHDGMGNVVEIRIDTQVVENGRDMTRTEFWTVLDTLPYMAVWLHTNQTEVPIDRLGDPVEFAPLSAFGIDFVPFVHDRFVADGGWGMNCVEHALLKVDEVNRQATRLHQILYRFNKPLWAVGANQVASDGSPIAPPKMKQGTNTDKTDIDVRDNTILYLPGLATIESLIPQIDYKAALEILQSQEKELEKDLPELLYYSVPERAEMSGKALRTLLGGAIDRAIQAQANFVESTVRLNQMCVTLGQFHGIFPAELGSFDDGSTNHSIRFQEQFPLDGSEKASTLASLVGAMGQENLKLAMSLAGFSEEEIAKVKIPQPKPEPKPEPNPVGV